MNLLDTESRNHYRSYGYKFFCTLLRCNVMGIPCIFQFDDREYIRSFRNHHCNYELDRVLNNLTEL